MGACVCVCACVFVIIQFGDRHPLTATEPSWRPNRPEVHRQTSPHDLLKPTDLHLLQPLVKEIDLLLNNDLPLKRTSSY